MLLCIEIAHGIKVYQLSQLNTISSLNIPSFIDRTPTHACLSACLLSCQPTPNSNLFILFSSFAPSTACFRSSVCRILRPVLSIHQHVQSCPSPSIQADDANKKWRCTQNFTGHSKTMSNRGILAVWKTVKVDCMMKDCRMSMSYEPETARRAVETARTAANIRVP